MSSMLLKNGGARSGAHIHWHVHLNSPSLHKEDEPIARSHVFLLAIRTGFLENERVPLVMRSELCGYSHFHYLYMLYQQIRWSQHMQLTFFMIKIQSSLFLSIFDDNYFHTLLIASLQAHTHIHAFYCTCACKNLDV